MSTNSSEYNNSSEVLTTRYAINANIETTRYFDSPLPDIEQQVTQNTQDINDLQSQINLKENISDHQTNINLLDASICELETEVADLDLKKESVSDHIADISTLQTSINGKESS